MSAEAQENVLTYVAANIRYQEHNMEVIQKENETLKRQLMDVEQQRPSQQQKSKTLAITAASTPRQPQSRAMTAPQKKVNILSGASSGGGRMQKQSQEYNKWLTDDGPLMRSDQFEVNEQQVPIFNVFEEMLGRSMSREM